MIDTLLHADFASRQFTSPEGGSPEIQTLVVGDRIRFGLVIQDRSSGELKPKELFIRSISAAVGKSEAAPTEGAFHLILWQPAGFGTGDDATVIELVEVIEDGNVLFSIIPLAGTLAAQAAEVQAALQDGYPGSTVQVDGTQVNFIVGGVGRPLTGRVVYTHSVLGAGQEIDNTNSQSLLGPIAFDATAQDIEDLLMGEVGGVNVTSTAASVWDVEWDFENTGAFSPPLLVLSYSTQDEHLSLYPESFVRISTGLSGETWNSVIQLVQAPLAFTSLFDRILPDAPSIVPVRDGAPREVGVTANTNEVQALVVPVDFKGTFYLRFDYRTSSILGLDDGPEEIAAALNAMYDDGLIRFEVSNPENEMAYIEFVGALASTDHPLMEAVVHSFEPGVPSFLLDLGKRQMKVFMRGKTTVKDIPFEVQLEIVDDEEDLEDAMVPGRPITLQTTCTLSQEQITEDLAEVPSIDWLKPGFPADYIPFSPDQIITGNQHYQVVIGDGVADTFVLAHNLGTSAGHIAVRESIAGGRLLQPGAEFQVEFTTANSVTLIFPDPPTAGQYAVTLTTAGPASAFQNHNHTIGQVTGLQAALDALSARLASIEDRMPYTNPGTPTNPGGTRALTIPDYFETFPGRFAPDVKFTEAPTPPLRVGGLLPAVHDGAPVDVTALPAVSADQAQQVVRYVDVDVVGGTFTSFVTGDGGNLWPFSASGTPPKAGDYVRAVAIGHIAKVIRVEAGELTVYPGTTLNPGIGTDIEVLKPPILIPGGLGRRSRFLNPGEYAACDGRVWYHVYREPDTDSFYPTDFDRELLILAVNDRMLRPGDALELTFTLSLQVLKSLTRAQYLLEIEVGTVPGQALEPGAVGVNLSDVVWDADPMLSQRIIVTNVVQEHNFGVGIQRSTLDAINGNVLLYAVWEGAPAESLPPTANFVIRAVLRQFDTENSVGDPKGYLHAAMTNTSAQIES